jgi:hypothetical protein
MRVAYLTAAEMVDPDTQRGDAFEHTRTWEVLEPAFADVGLTLETLVWDGPSAGVEAYDAYLIGTPWDYWRKRDAFVGALEGFARRGVLLNPLPMVRWNLDKGYLRELAEAGVPGIPTVWLDAPDAASILRSFDVLETDDLVLKRRVGAGAFGQVRLHRGDPLPPFEHAMLAQAFLPSIVERGETSLVYIDGSYSHAVRKIPAAGDYRIQSLYGGQDLHHDPTDAERAVARAALEAIRMRGWDPPVYARVDLVQREGRPVVIEVELVEPYLYPVQGPQLGERVATAVAGRLVS